jgi:Zn-finger nucleic acid-binding protein
MTCPLDGAGMRADGETFQCRKCRGLWVPTLVLARILAEVSGGDGKRYGAPRDTRDKVLACPDCGVDMEQARYGRSGVNALGNEVGYVEYAPFLLEP